MEKVIASKRKRFINLLVDCICIAVLSFVIFYLLSLLILKFGSQVQSKKEIISIDYFILIVTVAYYLLLEGLSYKTVGKYITNTKVLRKDGDSPSIFHVAMRTFIRILPFDFLTYIFGKDGWHDKLSGTIVVED